MLSEKHTSKNDAVTELPMWCACSKARKPVFVLECSLCRLQPPIPYRQIVAKICPVVMEGLTAADLSGWLLVL